MNIGILWHSVYPWDIRIDKFCRSITNAGSEVVVIGKGNRALPRKESRDGIRIYRVYARFPSRAFAKFFSAPLFFNPLWIAATAEVIRRERLRMLVVRDLPLALMAGLLGKLFRIPVVLDMAENYPAAVLAYRKAMYRPFLFSNAWPVRLYEKLSLLFLDCVIVVTEEQKERLEKIGYGSRRIFIVRNTPDCATLRALSGQTVEGIPVGRYIFYSGFLDYHRGIRTLILAFNEIRNDCPDLKLVLVGKGNEYGELQTLTHYLGLEERVLFKGWVDFRHIPPYIKRSALCVIPHLKTEHTDTTMPNKIFDYMFFGKPLIVSDANPLKRMISELGCGNVFRSGDYADLARAILEVLRKGHSPASVRHERRLVEEKYNWGNDSRTLMEVILNGRRPLLT